jgi:non-reducing end alpha-L-arabinofuranosidase
MKKIRFALPVVMLSFVAVSLGAVAVSCGSYASSSNTGGTGSASGGSTSSSASGGSTSNSASGGSTSGTVALPCDVLKQAGHACVSAHSTVRVLASGYNGPLYQVCKGSVSPGPSSCKGTPQDIGAKDGYADAAAQDTFCTGAACTITKIYDQSGQGNDLEPSPPGGRKSTPANPANATDLKVTINGHSVYGLKFKTGMGYRTGCSGCNIKAGNGIAKGDEPETMYMVTSQQDLVDGCCFDYGNAETTSNDDGNGTMEAVFVGYGVIWGTGSGDGPWVMADLENGLYAGWENKQDQNISTNKALPHDFITAVVVGDTQDKNEGKGRFALYGGDATTGTLQTMWDGVRPEKNGYVPMLKQGSIILSTGGDNSDGDGGRFYEGVMVNGAATKATVDALQASIVAAGYGK